MKKVGYQGSHGTFSEIAAVEYFKDEEIERIGFTNFKDIVDAVAKEELDYALLPVENTTTGIISRSYDLFKDNDIYAVGEINIPIREDLIVLKGTKIEDIKEVYSHPEALSQCQSFFEKHPNIKAIPYQDTAKSVEYIKECNDKSKAALGSWLARDYYELESLLSEIQDTNNNMTRFLVITKEKVENKEANKISMVLVLKHRPGALYNLLGILSKSGINILKLESRPIVGKVFEYMFYIDFEGNVNNREMKAVLKEIELHCLESKVLGNYKAYLSWNHFTEVLWF